MAITQLPAALLVQLTLSTLVAVALALLFAPLIAELLIRFRARRLPDHLAQRYSEEWIAEVQSITSRVRKLTFAIAISVMRSKALTDAEEGLPGLHGAPVVLSVEDVRVYSEFWGRVTARAIDSIIVYVVAVMFRRALRGSAPEPIVAMVFATIWFVVIHSWLVKTFGGSPGKLLMKLRVIAITGEQLQYRHAVLRALPQYTIGLVGEIVILWALLPTGANALETLPAETQQQLVASIPLWFRVLYGVVLFGWSVGEIAVYLNSYEGRALHDLVAGTVVVYKIPRVVGSLSDNPPVGSTSAYR